ncbi:MAG TPA: polysaccharide deacetylase family protein, partial [Chloroflexia bacterium]|nr:polysaccharide deacetylase family protein [Chloroflexia bacterium]
MRRALLLLLPLSLLLTALWGCDGTGLPTPTPVLPTPTVAATEVPTKPPTETATATYLPTATNTATVEPSPTATQEPRATATATTEPTARATEAPETNATSEPTATPQPRPTSTPATDTPPTPGEQVATPPTESAPTGGWKEVVRVAPGNHRVALTLDAGGVEDTLPQLLATLRARGTHVTIFITGKFAEKFPDSVRQAAADGHEIANHTYSHRDSRELTGEQLIEELARTEEILQGLTGRTSKPFWRPPYGARNNQVLNVAAAQGYRSIYWTLDSLDSVGQPKTPDFLFNRVTNP